MHVNSPLREYHSKKAKRELSAVYETRQWSNSMRILMYSAAAAATLAPALLTLPAQAASHRTYGYDQRSGGFGTGHYWQGEPTDRLPIWRYGYYQGNDPDPFIRGQIMRDPTNEPSRR
jgi:hypothetical protein